MYVFPKALESAWLTVGIGGSVKHGDALSASIGMAMVMMRFSIGVLIGFPLFANDNI